MDITTHKENGVLTIGSDETAGEVGVYARSVVDPDVQDQAGESLLRNRGILPYLM